MGLVEGECTSCGAFLTYSDKKNTITCKYCKKEIATLKAQKLYKSTTKDIGKKFREFQKYTDEINENLNRLCSYKVGVRTEKYALEQALFKTFKLQELNIGSSSIDHLEGITDSGIFVFKTNNDKLVYGISRVADFNETTLKKLIKEYVSNCDDSLLEIDKKAQDRNQKAYLMILLSIIKVMAILIVNFFLFKRGHPIFGIFCIVITIWIVIGSYINISDHLSSIDKRR